jgi:phosphoribosylformylglycinamidine cyclo-ligase
LKENITIKAFSHITGGGIIGNTIRVTPQNLSLKIDWNSWKPPYIFKFIQKLGNISDDEMRKVFNLGIGLIAIVDKNFADETIKLANQINEKAYVIGEVV